MSSPFATDVEHKVHAVAISMVDMERTRQVEQKGYACAHDDQHSNEELAVAAAFFMLPAVYDQDVCISTSDYSLDVRSLLDLISENAWPDIARDAESELGYLESDDALDLRIETVTRACALGIAELERLLRMREASHVKEG